MSGGDKGGLPVAEGHGGPGGWNPSAAGQRQGVPGDRQWPHGATLDETDLRATAESIARLQQPSGAIPWPDGHVDVWDHVECAMALSACGLRGPARRAYAWLRHFQRADGSWPRSTVGGVVTDPGAESHHGAYVAVGAWHEYMVTGDEAHVVAMWPTVRRAVDWALGLRMPRGHVAWERDAAGRAGSYALLSGCSSIHQGLRCAVALAKLADDPRPDWELAADRLAHLVAAHPETFADKSRFAMDWYYPVLGGAVRGADAARRLAAGWDRFVVPGMGVRCVSDQPWVTGAETCELALALDACGLRARAAGVFAAAQHLRHQDGSYWTGWQYASRMPFPRERSAWTAAAVVLAADALGGFSSGAGVFRDAAAPT
ncbi:MAG: prenyltransferase [Streptosporangiaceae bacterium]|nr:prenyltransferase [Streptosporangiaceae bacterium]